MTLQLPEGFILEENLSDSQQENQIGLPKGFILEQPKQKFSPVKAGIKGLIRGTRKLSQSPKFLEQIGEAFVPSVSKRIEEKTLQKALPSGESFTERAVERIGESIPFFAGGGPAGYLKSIAGGATAEGLRELGAPEWAQNLAELAIYMSPKGTRGQILPKRSQKQAVEFLRKKGLSEKEITPLIQGERRLRTLGKLASKGEKITNRLKGAHEKIGKGYAELKERGENIPLSKSELSNFEDAIQKQFKKLSPNQQKIIDSDLENLLSKPITVRSMIDFAQDVFAKGSKAGKEGLSGYRDAIKTMKGPIREYIQKASLEAAEEYKLLDEMYSKKQQALKILKPDQVDRIIGTGEAALLIKGVASGDLGLLSKVLGLTAARGIIREMLISPSLQNLSTQILLQTKKSPGAVINSLDRFLKEFKKINPKISEKITNKLISLNPANKQQSRDANNSE